MKEKKQKEALKSIREVERYLRAKGWKTSKSWLAEHKYDLPMQEDGTYLKSHIDKFAQKYLRKHDSEALAEKLRAEIRKLTAEAQKKELEVKRLREEFIDLKEAKMELKARAVFFKQEFTKFAYRVFPRIIECVGGDKKHTSDLINLFLDEIDKILAYYSRPLSLSIGKDDEELV